MGLSQPGSGFAFSLQGSDSEESGSSSHAVAMSVGPGMTEEAHTEHVLAVDLQPALETLFSDVIAGGLDLYHLTVCVEDEGLTSLSASEGTHTWTRSHPSCCLSLIKTTFMRYQFHV